MPPQLWPASARTERAPKRKRRSRGRGAEWPGIAATWCLLERAIRLRRICQGRRKRFIRAPPLALAVELRLRTPDPALEWDRVIFARSRRRCPHRRRESGLKGGSPNRL